VLVVVAIIRDWSAQAVWLAGIALMPQKIKQNTINE
jgi:hypothetical protein